MKMDEIPESEKRALKFLEKHKDSVSKITYFLYAILIVVGVMGIFIFVLDINENFLSEKNIDGKDTGFSSEEESGANDCNVAGINLHGTLLTYVPEHNESDTFFDYDVTSSESIVNLISAINIDENIKAIVVEVDSGGGSPVAGEEIANAIKNSEKPVVAFIRSLGASASYWSISSADRIFASKNSDVGSIGVTMSYLNNVSKNNKDGYAYEQLNAGKYKDAGNPDRALTVEEKALFLRDINIVYKNFMEAVSENRNIPYSEVKKIADGSTVLGERAKELGLVDEIGGINEVEKYLEDTIGVKPDICW